MKARDILVIRIARSDYQGVKNICCYVTESILLHSDLNGAEQSGADLNSAPLRLSNVQLCSTSTLAPFRSVRANAAGASQCSV